ncbi:hypothetical protein [Heliophilum fasciatum]|uniref:Uncharacterized protein n=1 Tax=Heliophilum fasciatum TaxID=35700 RepID=A0A4R2S0C2_9FIRM|nr:hypothetical protein [Heliophilum fasciatum]MCW2277720.1 hypothetical protein [Heliophilum fasciatum]TCP64785.1 hypothetical protein EDD73_108138 [Heliophilum fasciatum]
MKTTANYGLRKPDGTDTVDIADLNYNADQIDSALTPTADQTQVPTSNGPGTLIKWVSWFANRIKAITGESSWLNAPVATLKQLYDSIGSHSTDSVQPHKYADAGSDPSYANRKYCLRIINGEFYLEVVE